MELFVKLGLKEIASIIGYMGKNIDDYVIGTFTMDDKTYSYKKVGNEFTITDEDSRKIIIKINYEEQEKKEDHLNRETTYLKHEVFIDYVLPNGESIKLYNNIGLDRGYESFENVRRHDLLNGLKTSYCDKDGKELASFSLGLDEICLKSNNVVYSFSDEGIKFGNKNVTIDGNNLLTISGEEIPNINIVNSFNKEQEKKLLKMIIDEYQFLHKYTIDLLYDALRGLDRKERYNQKILEFYNEEIKYVKNAIDVRDKINKNVNEIIKLDAIENVENDLYFKNRNKILKK